MKIAMYQIDAFTSHVFGGNPAAVCVLGEWLADATMQAIAAENNLSETAFLIDRGDHCDLRWFTPAAEIDLAGHPTLAAAYAVFNYLKPGATSIRFESPSGPLIVKQEGGRLVMDFPSRPGKRVECDDIIRTGLNATPVEVYLARDHLVVFKDEETVRSIVPDLDVLRRAESMGVIVTAPGRDVDFVSRFFTPKMGIPEDPVTGSAHCTLIPYWAERLKKKDLTARQVSARGGELWCRDLGPRVSIAGHAVPFFEGIIWI